MQPFNATLDTKETAANVRDFVNRNMDVFWDIFKPLIPYIAILTAVDLFMTFFVMEPDPETGDPSEFELGGVIASYFYTCLVISWHRVVLDGPDKYVPMNPFKPQKSEWAFIGMGICVFLIPFICGLIGGVILALTGQKILFILLIPLMFFAIYLTLKLIFYFPSKATGNTITLKQSYAMTTGYIWKMFAANIRAVLKILLSVILYLIAGFITIAVIGGTAVAMGAENMGGLGGAMGALVMLPVIFYFQPLMTIIGVTVLSNYYQHALQNKPIPQVEEKPGADDMNKTRKALDEESKP